MKTIMKILLALFLCLLQGGLVSQRGLSAAEIVATAFNSGGQGARPLFEETLKRMRVKSRDLMPLLGEEKLKLNRFSVLLVGPFATGDKALSEWMRREAEALRAFVARGGTVLLFLQVPDFWDIEPWLPFDVFLLRGRDAPGRPTWIEEDHPLFDIPNELSLAKLSTLLPEPLGGGGAIRKADGFRTLARDGRGNPWCLETGWGKGRVVVVSWGPPARPAEPEGAAKKDAAKKKTRRGGGESPGLASLFVENAITYALEASRGAAQPLPEEAVCVDWSDEARLRPELYTKEAEREFSARVNAAVDRGIAYLKSMQKGDGSWDACGSGNGPYEVGPTSLALLALLVSGVNKHDRDVKRGFDWLLAATPDLTYEIAMAMMALEEKAAPLYERFEIERLPLEKRKAFRFTRTLSDDEKRYMEFCRDRLISHHARGGVWKYKEGVGEGDVSNGQYALLGLKAASRCGLPVDLGLWESALDYFTTYQQPSGPKVVLPRFKNFDREGAAKFYAERAEARGWQYPFGHPPRSSDVLGTHVCIGVACSVLCYEELVSRGKGGRYGAKVRSAVKDGLAWLYKNWSIDHRPNGDKFYYYYYIYSLERAGVLTGSRFIGDRDWYREGASYLMAKQNADGSWDTRGREYGTPVANAAFALLFLKRSTPPPVITVGR